MTITSHEIEDMKGAWHELWALACGVRLTDFLIRCQDTRMMTVDTGEEIRLYIKQAGTIKHTRELEEL